MTGSWQRIHAVLLRHYYMLRGSGARMFDVFYWPTIFMVTWGFIGRYFSQVSADTGNVALGMLLGAVMLWDVLFRVQVGMALGYLEEVWSRNLGHLFVSPLRPWEWWTSLMLFGFLRTLTGFIPAMILAIPFYGYSIFSMGFPLLLFVLNLAFMGWWIGCLVIAVLLKAGPGAEMIAWALSWFVAPFCAVYYPVSILPSWLQPVANAMPAAHVYEGMRALLQRGVLDGHHLAAAFALNAVYMALAALILQRSFNNARNVGMLMQTGE
jgi:ABC-2 type transport system permease protein